MKVLQWALLCLVVAGCKVSWPSSDPTKTGPEAAAVIETCFQADLPADAGNPKIAAFALMTLIVEGRVEISEEGFRQFLNDSALVPDDPYRGNPLAGVSGFDMDWWEPDALANPLGVSCGWKDGSDVASCDIAFGQLPGEELPTMFFAIVYESEDATGAEHTVVADPNWKPGASKRE